MKNSGSTEASNIPAEKVFITRVQKRRLFNEQKLEPDLHKLNKARAISSIERNNTIAKTERSGKGAARDELVHKEIIDRIEDLRRKCNKIIYNQKNAETIALNQILSQRNYMLTTTRNTRNNSSLGRVHHQTDVAEAVLRRRNSSEISLPSP